MVAESELGPLYERILATLKAEIVIIDWSRPDRPIIDCNPAFAELMGMSRETLIGSNFLFLEGVEREESLRLEKAIASKQSYALKVKSASHLQRTRNYEELTLIPIDNQEGNLVYLIGIPTTLLPSPNLNNISDLNNATPLIMGIVSEMLTPVSFIFGSLSYAEKYTKHILELLELYQEYYPHPPREIQKKADAIDSEFIQNDFPKLIDSMQKSAENIRLMAIALRDLCVS